MRLAIYTAESNLTSESFSYLYAQLSTLKLDTHVIAVRGANISFLGKLKRRWRKLIKLGIHDGMEVLLSLPIQRVLERRDNDEVDRRLRALPRPEIALNIENVLFVPNVNGAEAVATIESLRADILLQAGAGILRPQIFNLPRLGTINMHHGIAPAIRGMNSIYWALWENRPDWIGATIHFIDEGIDTGKPLAYFHVRPVSLSEGFPSLFVRATAGGVARMLCVIGEILDQKPMEVELTAPGSVYRSTFSGWKRLLLNYRLKRR